MVSAADRKKRYHDIPEEKKKQMLAARRQTYRLNKQRSIVEVSLHVDPLRKCQIKNIPRTEPLIPSGTADPFLSHPTHIEPPLLRNLSVGDVPGPSNAGVKRGRPRTKRDDRFRISKSPRLLPEVSRCSHCSAKRFHAEPSNFCCSGGDISLISLPMTDRIRELLTGTDEMSSNFRRNIRTYNNNLAFTSFRAAYDSTLTANIGGVYTFKVQGQVNHFLDPLKFNGEFHPTGIQLYFFDTDRELKERCEAADILDPEILELLMLELAGNPYSRVFKFLKDVPNLTSGQFVINADPKLDQRIYNLPSASQVAAVYIEKPKPDCDMTIPIQVYSANNKGYALKHFYGCYDPMQYPLLFPHGQVGWHSNIKRLRRRYALQHPLSNTSAFFETPEDLILAEEAVVRNGKKNDDTVTCREYYCYKFQMREDDMSLLLHTGRLFQQFAVDTYIKMETSRLEFHRQRQTKSRTEMLRGIVDGVGEGLTVGSEMGSRVYLSPSFIGGPRDMKRRYLDAMAIVLKLGKPDIFLTMTCNPNWAEIQENLKYGEAANDRPDLLARVFQAKVEMLKTDLIKKQLFGPVDSLVYVIEYQKRGLPHCHMLIILKPGAKPLGPEAYDRIVCAELPDPEAEPHLYSVVTKHMIHGPCGVYNPNSPCMKNGKCKYGFPKQFRQTTCHAEDGYPLYRRRDNGRTVRIRNLQMGNNWVVGYNDYLASTFDCHINVEICSDIRLIRYVHKDLFKGPDKVDIGISRNTSDQEIDEITQFQEARWVGPSEAMWRIYSFKLNYMKPSVYTLQIHLEGHQLLTFDKDADLESIANNKFLQRTTLTEFFKTNRYDPAAKHMRLLYKEFPEFYVWCTKSRSWFIRKQKDVIGRLVSVSPREGERYYLRLLLCHVRAPPSFDALLTVDGRKYSSYREAAMKLGLLSSDNYIEEALDEACGFQMPATLRSLFAILLVFCSPNEPEKLWKKYRHELCADLRYVARNSGTSDVFIEERALGIINGFLLEMGKKLKDYSLLPEGNSFIHEQSFAREFLSERNIRIDEEDLLLFTRLNPEQKNAYDDIMASVLSDNGDSFFIDGPGGTGKTFLYRALLATVRSQGFIALAVASSGVAASILPGGRTAHSRFKLPLDVEERQICSISKQSSLAKLIVEAKLIIWDEATMAKRQYLEALNLLLQDLMDSTAIFGGKVVVLGGDFRQTLPVIPQSTRAETVESSIIYSTVWIHLKKIRFEVNMRALADPEFSDFLLRIGEGRELLNESEQVSLPEKIVEPYVGMDASLNQLIKSVFSDLALFYADPLEMVGRCILATTNECVDRINKHLIREFPGQEIVYSSTDRTLNEKYQSDYEDLLNSLNPKGLPPHKLCLKVNCPIMLIRNLNPTEGLCNGTRLVCRELCQATIKAEIAFGPYKGKQVVIPRIPLIYDNGGKTVVPFKRFQFPIRLSFAMTINKSQGQTLDFVGLYLEQPVFSHGQLYVALSRARTSDCVRVLLTPPTFDEVRVDHRTKNVVYTEIFSEYQAT